MLFSTNQTKLIDFVRHQKKRSYKKKSINCSQLTPYLFVFFQRSQMVWNHISKVATSRYFDAVLPDFQNILRFSIYLFFGSRLKSSIYLSLHDFVFDTNLHKLFFILTKCWKHQPNTDRKRCDHFLWCFSIKRKVTNFLPMIYFDLKNIAPNVVFFVFVKNYYWHVLVRVK